MNLGSEAFSRKLRMEEDRFLMETGYTTQKISQFLKAHKEKCEKEDLLKEASASPPQAPSIEAKTE